MLPKNKPSPKSPLPVIPALNNSVSDASLASSGVIPCCLASKYLTFSGNPSSQADWKPKNNPRNPALPFSFANLPAVLKAPNPSSSLMIEFCITICFNLGSSGDMFKRAAPTTAPAGNVGYLFDIAAACCAISLFTGEGFSFLSSCSLAILSFAISPSNIENDILTQ